MRKSLLPIIVMIPFISCQKSVYDLDVCAIQTDIYSPEGFDVSTVGEIVFNGGVRVFQFVNDQIGYAMLSKSAGSYVEVFKTTDGGSNWTILNVGIKQHPRSMIFRDENFGIITVHDVTGCPPPNCQHKCVLLKTENGGLDWEEIEFEELKGILYYPQFDSEGNLYANLSFDNTRTILKSKDYAVTWDTLLSSSELASTIILERFALFEDKIFISAQDGKVVVIDINGEFVKTIETQKQKIYELEIVDENNLIAAVSGGAIKSTDGGNTWESIYSESVEIIGFETIDKGLMLLQKSSCPTDVYQVNDLIASTKNGGLDWTEAKETTTNLRINFSNSQRMDAGIWYMMIDNALISIKEK